MEQLKNKVSPKILVTVAVVVIAAMAFSGGLAVSQRNQKAASGPIQTQCDGTCVAVYDGYASPDTLAVKNGEFVQFNSADGKRHNLTIGGGDDTHHSANVVEEFTSGDFEGDEGWRVQFKKDGAYSFKDKYNSGTRINVIVYTEGKDYRIN